MINDLAPPKPTIAIRLGVTGHRKARLDPDEVDRIERQVQFVLDTIGDGLKSVHDLYKEEFSPAPALKYFVSALADGADSFSAECAMASGWKLLAPIPFSKADYEKDFSGDDKKKFNELLAAANAVAELDGLRTSPEQEDHAYLKAGIITVAQSDFLIAIWDGNAARGRAGTAVIKDEALSTGMPVIWINASSDLPPVFLDADGATTPFSSEALAQAIEKIVAPPPGEEIEHAFSGKKTHALKAYREFADESAHRFNRGSFYQFWEKMFAGKSPFTLQLTSRTPEEEISQSQQETLAKKLNASPHDQKIFNEMIIPRFVWADHLAIHYGNLYRSSYFFNYLFAAAAVFLALLDLVAGQMQFGSKTLWIGAEVTIIILILNVTMAGQRGRWHEKWIDYRQLAEEMRQYRLYFLTLGRDGRNDDLPTGEAGQSAGWVDWYMASARREAGMTSGGFDEDTIRSITKTILDEEIRPQIAYHNKKAEMLHKMEHRLHRLGEFAFGMTLLICIFYLMLIFLKSGDFGEIQEWAYKTEKLAKGWVTMMTGFLPALGAAFFGIRVQGEFGSTAERSHATAAQLQNIVTKYEPMTRAKVTKLETLRHFVEEAARAMLMENMDWRLLYISKPLNLPG